MKHPIAVTIYESGAPGLGMKVNIRGLGTIGNSSPLYFIDGYYGWQTVAHKVNMLGSHGKRIRTGTSD